MFRLSKTEEERATNLVIDGELVGEYVQCVEESCKKAVMDGRTVHLCLREVSAVDAAGRSLLSRLIQMGVKIQAAGIYTSYLIKALNSGKARDDESA